jgi:hypothetical protein
METPHGECGAWRSLASHEHVVGQVAQRGREPTTPIIT